MKLLMIGNSFTYDASVYISKIADVGNYEIKTVSVVRGGCSLEGHCENIGKSGTAHEYMLGRDGSGADAYGSITLDEVLSEDTYDVVSVQQASDYSGNFDYYIPYLQTLTAHIRKHQPNAKIAFYEIWANEYNCDRPAFAAYGNSRHIMHERVSECCRKAEELIGADIYIPAGTLISDLRKNEMFDPECGGTALTRDAFHMSLDYGRYAVGALWCVILGMKDLENNTFLPYGIDFEDEKIKLIKKTALNIAEKEKGTSNGTHFEI